ncbi:glycerol-3-phosphate acyltransferase [Indiicoccus explosivorum]|uniref:glycerol-3-phosphate acyltransferase n=1 Tax=Indiicoccus explosivorum TaxID=1917864 RepID=UPI000B43C059|nr:glycerol-3-phosphate acyltransferase [Indiicoccus explosivorum]
MEILLIAAAYLCGSFNGAYYVTKVKTGQDIRTLGSTNAGARNAGRIFGKSAFFFTVLLDAGKTILPLWAAMTFGQPDVLLGLMAFAVLAGHIWPLQLRGRGGKGVVVYLAATLMLAPAALPVIAVGAAAGLSVTKSFTKGGLPALGALPILLLLQGELKLAGITAVMLGIVILKHRGGDGR